MATTVAIALVSCGGTPSPAGGSSPTSGSARATSSSSPAAKAAGVPIMAKDITPREALFPDMIAALAQLQPDVKQLDLSSLLNQRFAQSAMDRGLTNF
jgi:hypothetical protein